MNNFLIIINADDLGKSHVVNTAIEQALAGGYISSSTIMANSNSLDEVLTITHKYTNASFGVHLNLTEGKSMTNNRVLLKFGIIDAEGCFKESNRELLPQILCDDLKNAIKEEWIAQVKLLKDYGFILSHLDGHHHCNSWNGLEEVVVAVAKENGISKVRNDFSSPFEINIKHSLLKAISKMFKPIQQLDNSYLKNKIFKYQQLNNDINTFGLFVKKSGIKTPDAFMSYTQFADFIKCPNVNFKNCVIELMCHPGHPYYTKETDMLMADYVGIKSNKNFKLISYNSL